MTVAGEKGQPGSVDGTGAQARFRATVGPMVADAAGNVYIAEQEVIRKVTPEGIVTTEARHPMNGIAVGNLLRDGQHGPQDRAVPA